MTDLEALRLALAGSVRMEPNKPLTNTMLLNVLKVAMAERARIEGAEDRVMRAAVCHEADCVEACKAEVETLLAPTCSHRCWA